MLDVSGTLVCGFAIAFLAISKAYVAWELSKLRAQGIYPQKGQATIDDVVRLKELGLKTYAIRCYREIYDVNIVKAKAAVEAISPSPKI